MSSQFREGWLCRRRRARLQIAIDEEAIDDDVATAMRWMLDQVDPPLEDKDDGRRDDEVDLQADEALDMGMGAYEDCEWQEDEGTGAKKAGSGEADVEEKEVVAAPSPKGAARGAALAAGADGEEAASFEGGSKAAAVADHGGSDAVVEEQQGGVPPEVHAALQRAAATATWQENSASVEAPLPWSGLKDVWLHVADDIFCRGDPTRAVSAVPKKVVAIQGDDDEHRLVVSFFLFASSPEVSAHLSHMCHTHSPHSYCVCTAVMLRCLFVGAGGQGIGAMFRWTFSSTVVRPPLQACQ